MAMQTRYETRTRILDAAGHEIYEGPVEHAPPHPDVEGSNPETAAEDENSSKDTKPASVQVDIDVDREKSAEVEGKKAKPASDANEATEAT